MTRTGLKNSRCGCWIKRWVPAAVMLMMLSACSVVRVDKPVTQTLGGNDPEEQIGFWHTLHSKSVTSNDDAMHGVLLFVEGQDPSEDYTGRVQLLKDRGLLPAHFDEPADYGVKRGTLAVMLVKMLDLKGGLTMRVLGPLPRYAVRELRYEGIYPPSSPHQTFTGSEFVSVVGRIEDFHRMNQIDLPAAQLPDQTVPQQDKAQGIP